VVLSKIDLLPPEMAPGLAAEWQRRLQADQPVLAVSSATGMGVERLANAIFEHVPAEAPAEQDGEAIADHAVYRPGGRTGFRIVPAGEHLFRIEGPAVERLVGKHDLENRDALEFIEERLRTMGVVRALESEGFEPGDEIEIGDVAFALYPGVPQPE
jgi:GTPase